MPLLKALDLPCQPCIKSVASYVPFPSSSLSDIPYLHPTQSSSAYHRQISVIKPCFMFYVTLLCSSRTYKRSLCSSKAFTEIYPWFGNIYLSLIHENTHTILQSKIFRKDRLRKFKHFLYVKLLRFFSYANIQRKVT